MADVTSEHAGADCWVVDDVPSNRRLIQKILKRAGYEVRVFADARVVMDELAVAHPSMILMDVMMPGISGIDALGAMQQAGTLEEVPVMLVTSMDDESLRERALHAGAFDFVIKPVNQTELLLRVERILSGRAKREIAARADDTSRTMVSPQVLFVSESEDESVAAPLRELPELVVTRCRPESAAAQLARGEFHALVTDLKASPASALLSAVDQSLRATGIPAIVLMSYDQPTEAARLYDAGATLVEVIGATAAASEARIAAAVRQSYRFREAARELMQQSTPGVDPISGLIQRRSFIDCLESELSRARRYGHDTSVLLVEVGGDDLPEEVPTETVRAIGDQLKKMTRGTDLAARLGPRRLGILLPETGAGGAKVVASRLAEMLAVALAGQEGAWVLSLGAASSRAGNQTAEELENNAAQALEATSEEKSAAK